MEPVAAYRLTDRHNDPEKRGDGKKLSPGSHPHDTRLHGMLPVFNRENPRVNGFRQRFMNGL